MAGGPLHTASGTGLVSSVDIMMRLMTVLGIEKAHKSFRQLEMLVPDQSGDKAS